MSLSMLIRLRGLSRTLLLVSGMALAGAAFAQGNPVKVLVGFPPGGGTDAIARVLAERLKDQLGVPVIVENKAGANGAIASEFVARAAPDGYTIMFGYIATHGINPALQKLKYDPVTDFEPIGMVAASPTLLVANNAVPVKNAKELMALVKAGDHVVSSRALFGSCLYILEDVLGRFGVEISLVDGRDLNAWKAAVRPDTKLVFCESVSNPTLEVIDLGAVANIAHANGAFLVVDNVFATPIFSYAAEAGADLIVYSSTKHIDGQGRCLGGVILGKRELVRGPIEAYLKHTGGAMSPFNAWVMLKSLDTMDLRVRAQSATAQTLAEEIEGHVAVGRVIYPGLMSHPQHKLAMDQAGDGGTVMAIDLKGGKDAAFRFLNALEIFTISNNFADSKSIVTHPATTTHQRLPQAQKDLLGITPGLIRLSCGLEDPADLLADVLQALAQV